MKKALTGAQALEFGSKMESEIMNAEAGLELPLAEPHFDDEATVLSARPVVPLDEVASLEPRNPRRFATGWVFAATVVGAMLIGVIGGVAYYSITNRQQNQLSVGAEAIVAGVDGMASDSADSGDPFLHPPAVQPTTTTNPEPGVALTQAPAVSRPVVSGSARPVARRVEVLTFPSNAEDRKAARRLAKQQRKEMERDGRDRNLTRIREIFEGVQRPQ